MSGAGPDRGAGRVALARHLPPLAATSRALGLAATSRALGLGGTRRPAGLAATRRAPGLGGTRRPAGPAATRPSIALSATSLLLALAGAAAAQPTAPPEPPPLGVPAPWTAPSPTLWTLPSGLRVAALDQRGLRLVHLTLVVKAGSALDGARPGLAAATADMLLLGGAGARTASALGAAFERLGAEPEVVTEPDNVTLRLAVTPSRLAPALALLRDLLERPRFDERAWRREKGLRLSALASERDEPALVAERELLRALFGDHPYGHPPVGRPEAVERLAVADLRAFFAARYRPTTTTLLVVGDLGGPPGPGSAVGRAVDEGLGSWRAAAAEAGPPAAPPPAPGPSARLLLIDRPGAPQSEVRVGAVGVPLGSPDHPSLLLLTTVLGGSFTSRLNQNLRERHGYAYDVGARVAPSDGPSPLLVHTAVRTDATAAAVGEILAELARLREPIAAGELDKARALLRAQLIDAFGDGGGASRLLADTLGHGLGPGALAEREAQLLGCDAARLGRDAVRFLDPARVTVVVVGDKARVAPSLASLPGRPPLEEIAAPAEAGRSSPASPRPPPPHRRRR